MTSLLQLQPSSLWCFFEKICAIPHPSKHEQQLSTWLQTWAKDNNLVVTEDSVGNVIIKKPATAGMQHFKTVVLQAHMDMVPQKNADSTHDFLTDPIKPYVYSENNGNGDEQWVTATNTTLGADNGIGLASILAILASKEVKHGALEALFTIDEEAGMTGAFGLEPGLLDGEILINTDSEQEGEVYMGCAGGIDGQATFALTYEPVSKNTQAFNLSISGLKGGHSGVDIDTGRANANQLLVRFLLEASSQFSLQLTELNGGSLRNAIPREADASFVIDKDNIADFKIMLEKYLTTIQENLKTVENNIEFLLISPEDFERCWTFECQNTILRALNACPNGVIRMSDDIKGIVETSLNLGVMRSKGTKFVAATLIRSLHDDGRLATQSMVRSLFELAGADIKFSGAYPGWKPETQSAIMQKVRNCYRDLFGKIPEIMVIHAGLECGLFKTSYPHWDMVSFGPTIKYPHSPDEKVDVASVEKYWQLFVNVLENIPHKKQ